MGDFRALLAALLGLVLLAPTARADPLLREFAVCAGRMTAAVEHDWLMMQDPTGAQAAHDGLTALVGALALPEDQARVTRWRTEARSATRTLLERGTFQNDAAARDRAAALIAGCRALVLPGT
jgi:hypothetical protein